LPLAIEIKFELDTKKATCAAVAIAAMYALCRVSEHSNSPQLAAANSINMIFLRTNMHNYYTQAGGIPQYINILEDAHKKGDVGWHAHCQH
jgi:hypothetical protein